MGIAKMFHLNLHVCIYDLKKKRKEEDLDAVQWELSPWTNLPCGDVN